MLKLIKKGDKYWLFEDSEMGLFSPSKFTINLLNNVITIVYENGLKSKNYNVIDCEIYDLGATSPFTTSSGDLFMQKLEELNCPCFQKNENIFNISADWGSISGNLSDQTDLQSALDSKLDKSTTPSSVYATDAGGLQVMKPTSDFKDVLEFANLAAFPATGETGKIYVALDTNFTYRWSGSAYVQIGGDKKQIFFTPGTKYNLATISACYSTNVDTGFGSDLISQSPGVMPTTMGIRWVLPLFISEKNQKLKEVNIRITNATFPTLRLVIFTGLSVNGSIYRINNQIIHDQNYTLSGGNLSLHKITSFTNDVTIPIGYDLCFFLIRVDGTTGTLSNFQISGYAS